MNYQYQPTVAGKLLKQGLEPNLWSSEVKQQFLALPITTPRPKLTIKGEVKQINKLPSDAQPLIAHQSLPLVDILRQMNIYSNNEMAQMLADIVGGAATKVEPSEIQLINGSGLGVENKISPRAAAKMLMAIENLLKPYDLEVSDIFPVAGRDGVGTMENRDLPQGVAVKTGTLNQVSALAGAIPVSQDRKIWFAIINSGWQIKEFRQQQDKLLQNLADRWQPNFLFSDNTVSETKLYLGDPQRNQIDYKLQQSLSDLN